jgi:hypothetical protein
MGAAEVRGSGQLGPSPPSWDLRARGRARELFDHFESLIAKCGGYEVAPAKTSISFMARVRFTGVNAVSDRGMRIAFALTSRCTIRESAKLRTLPPGGTALDEDDLT